MWEAAGQYTLPGRFSVLALKETNMSATLTRTDATVLDGLEAKVSNLEREIAGMRAEVREAYRLLRALTDAAQNMPAAPPAPVQTPAVPVQEDAPLPPVDAQEAATLDVVAPDLAARLLATSGTLTAFLDALAHDHASITGAKPVAPETVRANILHASPRFKSFRGVFDRAGVKNLLSDGILPDGRPYLAAGAREWLAGEDPAAPGHTRYASIMSGRLS